jgi:hypothetical protein
MAEEDDQVTDETRQSIIDAACRIAERFGVPVVILAAVLWMAREAATSVHQSIVVPMVSSHTEFLETTRETLHEIGKTQTQQAETLRELAIGQKDIQHELMRNK